MKKEEILAKLQAGELSVEEASKLLTDTAPKRGQLYCKVSEKGAISVYGLQRMPVTLYLDGVSAETQPLSALADTTFSACGTMKA